MRFWVKLGSWEKAVLVEEAGGVYIVEIDGRRRTVDCRASGPNNHLSVIIDHKSYLVESAPVKPDEGRYTVSLTGRRYELEVVDERFVTARQENEAALEDRPVVVRSPMPGLVIEVRVKPGDRVQAGSALVVMEAMKMRNELLCDVDGIVKAVNVRPNDAVESQAVLVEIGRPE